MLKLIFSIIALTIATGTFGQENLKYQKPPSEILELVDIELAPSVMMDDEKTVLILRYRDPFKSIAGLSQKEMRLAGLRIDPVTNIGSRTRYYNNIKFRSLSGKNQDPTQIKSLPANPRMSNFSWSPDQSKMSFTHTTSTGVELWMIDITTKSASKLTNGTINANMGSSIVWFKDSKSLLVKMIPDFKKELIDVETAIPTGPTISVSDGVKAQNRTYQDLLKNKDDEFNFEQLSTSELYKITLDGTKTKWLNAAMYSSINFSPDGEYILIETINKPFSYLVPYYRFPSKTTIYKKDASKIKIVLEVPLIEDLPKGFMAVRTGKRSLGWRNDKPSTIVYVEALDGGDPVKEVEYRDEVFQLESPFDGTAQSLVKTINRYSGITWGNNDIAILHDYWWNTRNTKTYLFNPSNSKVKPKVISDRNYQDKYSDPGNFETKKNAMGSYVLTLKGNIAYLLGSGFTKDGQFPFVDQLNLGTLKTSRLYQSKYTDKLENIYSVDLESNRLLVRIESPVEYPNYYFRSLKNNKLNQLTSFKNPFLSIQNIRKEVINYERADGLALSGTLYYPLDYDDTKKEKYPMILWAYPREYKDKSSASQSTQNANKFTYPFWASPIFWVTKGYVVLDNAAFPIVGEGDEEPNDSFRSQLVANAQAAIDAVNDLGLIDTNKVAVGGHSYGAFMVANLLSHSNLFAAGIARSGAYNRTLTPFGFQSEERSYWDAPEVYNTMSPFMHADKMKTPLLLIHGAADNNSGTYPLQSERYFNALKGLGATVRLVMFPKESHGYSAKESILHMLWEQDQWLDKYVKNKVK